MFTLTSPLAEILRESPNTVGVFHRHGLDYCCGGKTPLNEACLDRGIDPRNVYAELVSVSDGESFGNLHVDLWPTAFLVDFIVSNHHAFVRTALPLAISQMTKVVTKHGERFLDAPAILELLMELQTSLMDHLEDEERVLFSASAKTLAPAQLRDIVQAHEQEHVDVGRKLQRLRAITNDFTPPEGACTTHRSAHATMRAFYEDTMQHVFLENAILFPRFVGYDLPTLPTHH